MYCSMRLALSHLKLYVLEVGRGEEVLLDVSFDSVKKGAVSFFFFKCALCFVLHLGNKGSVALGKSGKYSGSHLS